MSEYSPIQKEEDKEFFQQFDEDDQTTSLNNISSPQGTRLVQHDTQLIIGENDPLTKEFLALSTKDRIEMYEAKLYQFSKMSKYPKKQKNLRKQLLMMHSILEASNKYYGKCQGYKGWWNSSKCRHNRQNRILTSDYPVNKDWSQGRVDDLAAIDKEEIVPILKLKRPQQDPPQDIRALGANPSWAEDEMKKVLHQMNKIHRHKMGRTETELFVNLEKQYRYLKSILGYNKKVSIGDDVERSDYVSGPEDEGILPGETPQFDNYDSTKVMRQTSQEQRSRHAALNRLHGIPTANTVTAANEALWKNNQEVKGGKRLTKKQKKKQQIKSQKKTLGRRKRKSTLKKNQALSRRKSFCRMQK